MSNKSKEVVIVNAIRTPIGAYKGSLKNIVYGINDHQMSADDKIITAASCTTNAIAPVLKVVNDRFGISHGHVETVHAYTNDQNLIDNYHKGSRRGRSAALNMVLTETGAAKAVVKAVPELAGKLTGNAVRVPIPNVSMAIMNLNWLRETTKDERDRASERTGERLSPGDGGKDCSSHLLSREAR